jgi:arsenite methyltransferase
MKAEVAPPSWALQLLASELPEDGSDRKVGEISFFRDGPIIRSRALHSAAQQQTADVFGFKWAIPDGFESEAARKMMRDWARERYGDPAQWIAGMDRPVILDAGCGAAYTALEYFQPVLDQIRYLGTDISSAVDVARRRMMAAGSDCAFIQSDLNNLPVAPESVDIIFSEGVLHHTDSTRDALAALVPLVRQGGLVMFYVYRKKGPIREFTDDYVRDLMQPLSGEAGWEKMMQLTKLGKTLGDLDIEIEIDEPIDLLQIPAGKINLQRLFYWHVLKAYYRPEFSLDEMNHVNFDWFAPRNARRHTIEEVSGWCDDMNLVIERQDVQDAGITIIARKQSGSEIS